MLSHPVLKELALAINHPVRKTCAFEENPVPLKTSGSQPPLFLIHETSGDPLVYLPLVALLPEEIPVYALQALEIHLSKNIPTSLEVLASEHIQSIRTIQPHGPYYFVGWSIGGVIAYEIAKQLTEQDEVVSYLGMIDSYNPVSIKGIADDSISDESLTDDARMIGILRAYLKIDNEDMVKELFGQKKLSEAIELSIKREWLPKELIDDQIETRLHCHNVLARLGYNYNPKPSGIKIDLFAVEEVITGDVWRGWGNLVDSESKIHFVGGDHMSVMQLPFVTAVADALKNM